tara:strand:- start:13136 stop:13639 length:504 start_codon:yes stop_codon:yes gene_type:complete
MAFKGGKVSGFGEWTVDVKNRNIRVTIEPALFSYNSKLYVDNELVDHKERLKPKSKYHVFLSKSDLSEDLKSIRVFFTTDDFPKVSIVVNGEVVLKDELGIFDLHSDLVSKRWFSSAIFIGVIYGFFTEGTNLEVSSVYSVIIYSVMYIGLDRLISSIEKINRSRPK